MTRRFGLYLGNDEIPVINWINRHGSPEGRDLRFTVPLEAKATFQAHPNGAFRLERDGESWDLEFVSLDLHSTGTNGVRLIGRVKSAKEKSLAELSSSATTRTRKTKTGVGIPSLDGSPSESSLAESSLEKLKQKPLRKRATTEHGNPLSEPSEASAKSDAQESLPSADEESDAPAEADETSAPAEEE